MKRREFLVAGGAAVLAPALHAAPVKPVHFRKRIKFGISTYSYWHFEEKKFPVETVIERAAEFGVEAVDILHRQMELNEKGPFDAPAHTYCRKLRQLAFKKSMDAFLISKLPIVI